jgi:uncharacterized protein (TIGR03032 family)
VQRTPENINPTDAGPVNPPPAPFSCKPTPNMAELLFQLNATIMISTYQAGKVVFFSSLDTEQLIQLPRNYQKAMGLAVNGNSIAVATRNTVEVLVNSTGLAPNYGKNPGTYDGLFVPRATYHTGEIDLHDMEWGEQGLYGINTRFSCISLINDQYSFQPIWQPQFITDLEPSDRCHLNGMAMQDGKPKYVTALGDTDTGKGWREKIETGGIVMDVESNQIITRDLAMPHSPRIYNGELYVLLSATGQLVKVNPQDGTYEVVIQLDGFLRGMDKYGDYLFIGLSKLRKNSSAFRELPIADKANFSGIDVIHLPTASKVAHILYEASVDEIYDVKILPNMRRPGILNTETPEYQRSIVTPTDAFWSEPDPAQQNNQPPSVGGPARPQQSEGEPARPQQSEGEPARPQQSEGGQQQYPKQPKVLNTTDI